VLRRCSRARSSRRPRGRKLRRPYEDVVGDVRVLGILPGTDGRPLASRDLCWELQQLGQAPFGWHPPDGYPDVAAAWTGTGHAARPLEPARRAGAGVVEGGLLHPGRSLFARLLPGPRRPPAPTSSRA
jgi:uncharacterized protein (DUF1800 family)